MSTMREKKTLILIVIFIVTLYATSCTKLYRGTYFYEYMSDHNMHYEEITNFILALSSLQQKHFEKEPKKFENS